MKREKVRLPILEGERAPGTAPVPTAPQRPFHVLAKPTGALCNLDCKYCFFLSKEALYPDSNARMGDDVLEAYVRQVVESQPSPHVSIAWQGGEPTLMGIDFFRRAIALVEKVAAGKTVEHTLQTNGVLLDDAWCELFREHKILVGLSMDGPREMHDAYRVDKGGKSTFDAVMRAAKLLDKHRVDVNILCSVHAANAEHPVRVYRFFRDEVGARYLQFIPIVERVTPELLPIANEGWGARAGRRPLYTQSGNQVTARTVEPSRWGSFLIGIFDEWASHDVGDVFVQMFDATLASFLDMPATLCIFAETCGDALALEHNGDLYSCDHFVEPAYKLGNILEHHMLDLVASERQRAFGAQKRDTLPSVCRSCDVRFACHGECPRNRFLEAPNGEPGLNYLCEGYKAFFHHVDGPMRRMASALRRGTSAPDAMAAFARESPP